MVARELARLATAGSVDDGKSTLIGRLLYDTKSLFEDQWAAVEAASAARGHSQVDLALLTDGLRAEREQGITIDVAHRYFATPRRAFILADTPGHPQYTRNMVTGASTADVALILLDARKGLVEQGRRHAFIANLLRVPHLVFCVNKMDLVDWSEDVFETIRAEVEAFTTRFEVADIAFVPISALHGDNVVTRSPNLGWYEGAPLLRHLEEVHIASDANLVDLRLPVQYVIRPRPGDADGTRGYAGQLAGGVVRVGEEVIVLPSGLTTTVVAVEAGHGALDEAFAPLSVVVQLADDVDLGRGDMICRPHNQPSVGQDLEALVCWMDSSSVAAESRFVIKHTTRSARAVVKELRYRFDVNTLHRQEDATSLGLNDMGRVRLRVTAPLMFDSYRRNRATGAFILIDEVTNATAGAGMILGPAG